MPARQSGETVLVAVDRHAGMVQDDERVGIASGQFGSLAHLGGIELEVEGEVVFAQQPEAGEPGGVGEEVVVGEAEVRIPVPIDDLTNAADIAVAAEFGHQLLDVGFVQFDASDDGVGQPSSLRRLLQPARLCDRTEGDGFDVHGFDEIIVGRIGAVLGGAIVAGDRREIAEHPLAGRLILQPGIFVTAAQLPEMVVRIDNPSLRHPSPRFIGPARRGA